MALSAVAAVPTVTDVTAKQRFPWNGLVDITCTVTGIDGTTNGLYFAVSAVNSGATNNVSHLWVVQNGTKTADYAAHTNGNYKLLWDAQADLGTVIYSNMVVSVTFDSHDRVQLWEGGPYWATTNIGAEEPWEYGYYFWWGDTIGYKRENDSWVASDGSSSSFSFDSSSALTYNKSASALLSEGWIEDSDYCDLVPEHDAAHVQWGGGWRIPTDDELYKLTSRCDWTKTATNGVNGYIIRGRGDYVDKSIFVAGDGYWSSCTSVGNPLNATWLCVFESGNVTYTSIVTAGGGCARYKGRPIRPVQGPSNR